MKKTMLFFLLLLGYLQAHCQDSMPPRLAFTAHALVQAYSIPFASPATYFKNKGLDVSLSYRFSRKSLFQQDVALGYFFNQFQGNTYMVSSSTRFTPIRTRVIQAGISLGAGYMQTGFNEGGWEQQENGDWVNGSNQRRNLFIPASAFLQVKAYENERFVFSPVLSYQLNALLAYSHATIVLPQSLLKAGLNLQLK